jgi:hypothetical protein
MPQGGIMPATTQARDTLKMGTQVMVETLAIPAKANVKINQGAFVVFDAGVAAPGRTAVGLIAAGKATDKTYDNTGGALGAIIVKVERGTFRWANSSAGDLITQADVGADCFIVDDQTVAKTNGGATRSRAGKILAVEAAGVWVETL